MLGGEREFCAGLYFTHLRPVGLHSVTGDEVLVADVAEVVQDFLRSARRELLHELLFFVHSQLSAGIKILLAIQTRLLALWLLIVIGRCDRSVFRSG